MTRRRWMRMVGLNEREVRDGGGPKEGDEVIESRSTVTSRCPAIHASQYESAEESPTESERREGE